MAPELETDFLYPFLWTWLDLGRRWYHQSGKILLLRAFLALLLELKDGQNRGR